ncbi:beta/gamma crystallin-related protein [Nitrospirillum sp. BR 11164]|uniref:beta/gamma crystallin-related protein n=1 Tax=Nitrospirillum sp. BR 11164 TaxID=3104324 RepID=UPI002AFF8E66|nr:beta/gamma crystallin-related protein [Nitrospirillum sp. BR 11164]MEA1651377.1 beta/gamma crystallin-related protein [Nitrospirillum sp. BR 11164]
MTRLMHRLMGAAVLAGTLMTAGGALAGEITLFSEPFFRGDALTVRDGVENLADMGRWNDRAKSMIVRSGEWEVCKNAGFRDCKRVGRGTRIGDLGEIGLFASISSARQIDGRYYQPEPPPPPPPVYGPPPSYGGGITWNNGPGAYDQPPPRRRRAASTGTTIVAMARRPWANAGIASMTPSSSASGRPAISASEARNGKAASAGTASAGTTAARRSRSTSGNDREGPGVRC